MFFALLNYIFNSPSITVPGIEGNREANSKCNKHAATIRESIKTEKVKGLEKLWHMKKPMHQTKYQKRLFSKRMYWGS